MNQTSLLGHRPGIFFFHHHLTMDIAQQTYQDTELKCQSWLNHGTKPHNGEKQISSHEKTAAEILHGKINLKEACLEQIYQTRENTIRKRFNRKAILISPGIRFDRYTKFETKIRTSGRRFIDDIFDATMTSIHDIFLRATNNSQIRKCFREARLLIIVELHRVELFLRRGLTRIQLYNRSKLSRSFFVSFVVNSKKCKTRKHAKHFKSDSRNNIENLSSNSSITNCLRKDNAIHKNIILSEVKPTNALTLLQLINWKYRKRQIV